MLGIGLLTTTGNTHLACDRVATETVQCTIENTTSLGIIPKAAETINRLETVNLDTQTRRIYDVATEGSPPTAQKKPAYGIFLVGERQVLLNGYEYDRDRQEQRLQKIHSFLQNPEQKQLTLNMRNLWSTVITLTVLSGVMTLFLASQG